MKAYRCSKCKAQSGKCPECGRRYAHGTVSHCKNPPCATMNAPIDCSCGFVVADTLDGVLDFNMRLIPFEVAP